MERIVHLRGTSGASFWHILHYALFSSVDSYAYGYNISLRCIVGTAWEARNVLNRTDIGICQIDFLNNQTQSLP